MGQNLNTGKINSATQVQYLKGVGPNRAEAFEQLGVKVVADLLEYYPRDWQFMPQPTKISQLKPDGEYTIVGLIESVDFFSHRRPAVLEVYVADETGPCRIIWFNGGYLRNQIMAGKFIMAFGKVGEYKHNVQFTNPRFILLDDPSQAAELQSSPAVYPATAKLSSQHIRRVIKPLIASIDELAEEYYSEQFRKTIAVLSRPQALAKIHDPADENDIAQAKRRLKFDELFLMQLALALKRYRLSHYEKAGQLKMTDEIDSRIRRRFPFLLTEDQNVVIAEICAGLAKSVPMNRLLQGDVGSGKTVVALYAALVAVANKKQVAIMAPTEILAAQHFNSIEKYLKGSAVRRCMIAGGLTGKKRQLLLDEIKTGRMDIVVGTIALLEHDIEFQNLGLIVIDEQHKFGVEQRSGLRKNTCPHCLVMTATPIPRTITMTAFGDLDVSVIKSSPPGRGAVVTRLVAHEDRTKAFEFIRERLKAKKQAYFVYPRITSEEDAQIKAAVDEYEILSKKIFREFKVELLHGQMTAEQKQDVMSRFRSGHVDVLVSTVVIEVGVDVPNATIMVIEDADRFGLAQLHQLRGRIGRGESKSYCLLFSNAQGEVARNRLGIMVRSNNGFEIADHDFKIRGPGEMFSTRQHGMPDFKIADISSDFDLLMLARKCALEMVQNDPFLTKPDNINIRKALLAKFKDTIFLADIA
ncbi:MAG: ATP-dependent DNA helicase RecG [Planctomycetes bacterium GWF2_50_10]|nr:MAG: ATP-dependent DNA helicase RecG [Planctomycetes bacterium GWF2_50_10]